MKPQLTIALTLADARGNAPPSSKKPTGDGIAALAPGLPSMPGAVAVVYSVPNLIAGARTTIHYAKPCEGVQDVTLPVKFTDAAVESLKGWRFEPARINGARLYQAERVMVVVK